MQQVLFIELNEVNFDFVRHYSKRNELPNLARLIDEHGVVETESERNYEELEPWIQWVTAHTGMPFAEHKVFRLGDIVSRDYEQIWEHLEKNFGVSVGAISPMNAKNRTADAAFFVPDPWTSTTVTSGAVIRKLYAAIRQVVGNNASSLIRPHSLLWLAVGALLVTRPRDYATYMSWFRRLRGRPWIKAMVLDKLLADLFTRQVCKHEPGFASLFLNAGAHIQHHYMFSSAAYEGDQSNPDWYVGTDEDPLLDIYRVYDSVVGGVLRDFPSSRLMIATGLHQDPHPVLTYYWRLRDHAEYLRKIGVPFIGVEPRMSRDFLVTCSSPEQAQQAAEIIASAKSADGVPLFSVDNRGSDLFIMLEYPGEIKTDFVYTAGDREYRDLAGDVAFVAIKNGQHNGVGYFLDTGFRRAEAPESMLLANLFDYVSAVFASAQKGEN